MIVVVVFVLAGLAAMYFIVEWLDRKMNRPKPRRRPQSWERQPNEDDPELMAFIRAKLRHLEEDAGE